MRQTTDLVVGVRPRPGDKPGSALHGSKSWSRLAEMAPALLNWRVVNLYYSSTDADPDEDVVRLVRNADRVVGLGREVHRWFVPGIIPLGAVVMIGRGHCTSFLAFPHPSGRARVWNDQTAVSRYTEILRNFTA